MTGAANAINESTTGITGFTGTGFTGTAVTNHNLLVGGSTSYTLTNVAPSSTSGVPVISQGSSSDPTFGTAVVAGGGTGVTSFTAYALLCGGTTSTGNLQNVSGVGTSGQVLTSGGASSLPSWQDVAVTSVTGTAHQIAVTTTAGDAVVSLTDGIYVGTSVTPPTGGIQTSGQAFFGSSNAYAAVYSDLTGYGTTFQSDANIMTPASDGNSYGFLTTNSPQLSGTVAVIAGFSSQLQVAPTNTYTLVTSFHSKPSFSFNNHTVTNWAGFYQGALTSAGSGTITNAYGGYFTAPTAGSSSNIGMFATTASIGYATTTPPSNGLLVEGQTAIGTSSANSDAQLTISTAKAYGIDITGTSTALDGNSNQCGLSIAANYAGSATAVSAGIINTPNFETTGSSGIGSACGMYVQIGNSTGSHGISAAYGILVDINNTFAVAPTYAYGAYFTAPEIIGSTALMACYADNIAIGTSNTTPPSNGLLVDGNIQNTALTAIEVVATDSSKNLVSIASSTSGYVLTSNGSGSAPTFQAPAGSSGLTWSVETTSFTMVPGHGYFINGSGQVTATLPSTTAVGDTVAIIDVGGHGWVVAQNSGQQIRLGTSTTTTGTGGSLTSTENGDGIFIYCWTANTSFVTDSMQGNISVA